MRRVRVRALKPKPLKASEALREISALPDWARPAFAGMKSLNRIQSAVCDAALFSGENMLICAPTGEGACGHAGPRVWLGRLRAQSGGRRVESPGESCRCMHTHVHNTSNPVHTHNTNTQTHKHKHTDLPPPPRTPGAGKTNVAVLTIMHQIGLHRRPDGEIDRSAFKIVYIAPMKARP